METLEQLKAKAYAAVAAHELDMQNNAEYARLVNKAEIKAHKTALKAGHNLLQPKVGQRVNFHHAKAKMIMRGVYLGTQTLPHAANGTWEAVTVEVENQPFYGKGKVRVLCSPEDITAIIGA